MIIIRTILVIRGRSHEANAYSRVLQEKEKIYSERFRKITDGSKNLYGKEFTPIF